MTPLRIAVCQRFLPHYRLAFYEELLPRLRDRGYELRLFHSYTLGDVPAQPWTTRVAAWSLRLKLGELTDSAVFPPLIVPRLAQYRPDLVVLEDISNLPASLMVAMYCRMRGVPYLIWGLGNVPGKTRSRLRKLLSPFINFFYRNTAGFIGYSRWAQTVYAPMGKPVYVAPNACLATPSSAERMETELKIEERSARSTCSILTIGELKAQKRIDMLLQTMARLKHLPVNLHVIGGGPELESLKELSRSLGVGERVTFYGSVYATEKKRAIIEDCTLGVLPGRGGLVIQEMMYHGLPVVCGPADGTERDRVVDQHNGFLLEEPIHPEKIAATIESFVQASPLVKRDLARAALDTVVNGYNISSMADGFIKAVEGTLQAQKR